MHKVNDYVVYGSIGVCRISDIVSESDIHGKVIEFYVLSSVSENHLTIKAPVTNPNVLIRKVISKDEISSLISLMSAQETIWIKNGKERNIYFKNALKSGRCEEWIKVIKTIYLEKQVKIGEGKKLAKSDEDIMQAAEKKLHGELAIALNISPDKVLSYILEHIA